METEEKWDLRVGDTLGQTWHFSGFQNFKNISISKSSAIRQNFTRNENESISGEAYVGSAVGGIMDKGGVLGN